MTSRVSHASIDCTDPYTPAEWRKGALGYVDIADDPNEPGHEECIPATTTESSVCGRARPGQ